MPQSKSSPKMVCYISSFHKRKLENATLMPDQIDPFMCTHLIYSMAKIDDTSYDKILPFQDDDLGI